MEANANFPQTRLVQSLLGKYSFIIWSFYDSDNCLLINDCYISDFVSWMLFVFFSDWFSFVFFFFVSSSLWEKLKSRNFAAHIKGHQTKSLCQELFNQNIFARGGSLCSAVTAQQCFSGAATAEWSGAEENVRSNHTTAARLHIHTHVSSVLLTSTELHTRCLTYPGCRYSALRLLFLPWSCLMIWI